MQNIVYLYFQWEIVQMMVPVKSQRNHSYLVKMQLLGEREYTYHLTWLITQSRLLMFCFPYTIDLIFFYILVS